MISNTKAVILAGGLGTRLRSVVANRPKVLAAVNGRPFLFYLLDQLVVAGANSVILCTGYMGELVRNTLGTSYGDMQLSYSQEDTSLGTAGALRQALSWIQSDTVLVMNGDSICRTDLNAFSLWHSEKRARASLLLANIADTSRFGRVEVDDEGSVQNFVEKGSNVGPGWINAGIYLISRDMIEAISTRRAVSLEREIFPQWIGHGFYAYKSDGSFLDIGTPEDYAKAKLLK